MASDTDSDQEHLIDLIHLTTKHGAQGSVAAHAILIDALGHESVRVRKAAVHQIVSLATNDLRAALLTRLMDTADPQTRSAATEAIVGIGRSMLDAIIEVCVQAGPEQKILIDIVGSIGDPRAISCLVDCCDASDPNIQMAAAEALGRIADDRACPKLIQLTSEPNFMVAAAGAEALWRIASPISFDVVAALITNRRLRRSAVKLSGLTASPTAVHLILDALSEKATSIKAAAFLAAVHLHDHSAPSVTRVLMDALRAANAAIRPAIAEGLSAKDPAIRQAAARMAAWTKDPTLLPLLLTAATDEETEETAIEAVLAMGHEFVHSLPTLLESADRDLRRLLYEVIGRMPQSYADRNETSDRSDESSGQRIESRIIEDLDLSDTDLTAAAARVLGVLGGREAIAILAQTAARPFDEPTLAPTLGQALGRLSARFPDEALRAVMSIDDGCMPGLLPAVARAFPRPELVDAVARLAAHPDNALRLTAMEALRELQPSALGTRLVIQALGDEDPPVRAAAAHAATTEQGQELEAALMEELADRDETVRAAAASALGRMGVIESTAAMEKLIVEDPSSLVVITALDAFESLAIAPTTDVLLATCARPQPDVVQAALSAACLAKPNQRIADAAHGLTEHPQWYVRLAAIAALEQHATPQNLAQTLERLQTKERDDLVLSRIQAVLDRLGQEGLL